MNRVALFVSLAVAALGVILLVLYIREFEKTESGGERIRLLVAKQNIDRGTPITEDNVDTKEVPLAYVEERAIKMAEKSKVIGLKLSTPIQPGQTIMWTDLTTSSEERRDLSSLITPGRRGVAIRTSRDDHGIQLVKPGDYVDVLVVTQKQNQKCKAAIILQKILVLAKGIETNPEAQQDNQRAQQERDSLLTLSLQPSETQLLQVAAEQGRLTVAIRNPNDPRTGEYPDVDCAELDNARQASAGGRPAPTAKGPEGPINLGDKKNGR